MTKLASSRNSLATPQLSPEGQGLEKPKASIVVGVRNMEKSIGRCIESLLACEYNDKEIIIVNDGSTDDTAEVISTYPVILIDTEPKGISNARNVGFKEARGEVIAYTDGDCVVARDWLSMLIRHFDDDRVALVGGRTEFQAGKDIASVCRRVEFKVRYSKVPKVTLSAMGPNCTFRRRVLQEIGGFNPLWFHGEDAEVSYTIYELGYKIVYEPSAVVYHAPEEGLRRYLTKRVRDASAFVRVSIHHPSSSLIDRFIGSKLIFQPFLFALSILLLPFATLFIPFALTVGLMLSIGFLWNFPEAAMIWRETGKIVDLLKGLAVLFLRGLAWGLGLIIGILRILKHIFPKRRL